MQGTLRDSPSTLQAVIQASPLAIMILDMNDRVTMWNPAAERMFGWSEEEVLGRRPPLIPDDKQVEFRALRERALAGEPIAGVEVRRYRKDGSPIDVRLWTASIRDAAGRIDSVFGLLEDITERKQAERTLAKRTTQLEAVRLVGTEIARELDLTRVLALIHRRAMQLMNAEGGSLYLWDEETRQLIPKVWHDIPDRVGALPLRLGEGVCGAVAERGAGLIVNDYRESCYAHLQFLAETPITAVLAEPLRYRDRLVGVIAVNRQGGAKTFSEEDQQLLGLFAAQAAVAIENAHLYQNVERQRREIELVADLSQQLNASLDLDTVLQRLVEGARDLTGSDLAQIALRDEPSDTLGFRYRAGSHSQRLDTHRIERGKGIGGIVMVTGQPFRTACYAEDARITKEYLAYTLAENVVAELAVPIRMEGRVEGVLFVDNRSPRPFTDRDEQTLLRLADHAAIAIRNARLHAVAIQRARQLDTLNKVALALTTELDPRVVANGVLQAVRAVIQEGAGLLLEQPHGFELFRTMASIDFKDARRADSFELAIGEGLAGIAAATRQPIVSADVTRDPRFARRSWAVSEGFVSGIVLPLLYGDRVNGVLGVFLRRPHDFTDHEIDLLRALAAQSAVALENARLFEQVYLGRRRLLDLTQRVVSAQEEERRRLSRELHDEAGQALTALAIHLGLIRGDLPSGEAQLQRRLDETLNLTESITDRLRFLAQGLRPPALDAVGLDATLEGLCREFGKRSQLAVTYVGADLHGVSDGVGIHLYRFLQEALTNVGKHARAHRVRVELTYDGQMLNVFVEDDGVGFDVARQLVARKRGGIGLIGMQERLDLLKGQLEITSRPGEGTRLVARVPWKGAS